MSTKVPQSFPTLLQKFFTQRLIQQQQVSPRTVAAYRDPTTADYSRRAPADSPRQLGGTVIDFSTLHLPPSVSCALAEAFWNQVGARSEPTVRAYSYHLRVFGRFVAETQAVGHLNDIDSALLVRYIEWLNRERGQDGVPWSKGTRYSTYTTLRTLLRWLQRCRPDLLGEIEFPVNAFPWKNRDVQRVHNLPVQTLRAILKACEQDITDLRVRRDKCYVRHYRRRNSLLHPELMQGLLRMCFHDSPGRML